MKVAGTDNPTSLQYSCINKNKSGARFCCQMAEWVPHIFCNVCVVKNHKSAKYSITTGVRENISTNLEYLEFYNFLCMFNLDTIKFYIIKLATILW
jgi:hypothetical protein